jgi:hypothetical protein
VRAWISRAVVVFASLSIASPAAAQGLGQAAQKEKERRARQGSGARTITAEDLNPERAAWQGWQPFTSEEHRFTVAMPAYPSMRRDTDRSPLGIVRRTTYTAVAEDMTYGVIVADYPPEARGAGSDVFFNAVRDGMLTYVRGSRLKSEKPIRLASHPGREFSFSSPVGLVTNRAYISGERVYLLMVVSPSAAEPSRAESFFSSLEIRK